MYNTLQGNAILQSCCKQFLLQSRLMRCLKPDHRNSQHGGLGPWVWYVVSMRQNWCEFQQGRLTALWGLSLPQLLPKEAFWGRSSDPPALTFAGSSLLHMGPCSFFSDLPNPSCHSPTFYLNVNGSSSCSFLVLLFLSLLKPCQF